ncbi:MAG: acetyl-CoA carboxylase biotin carboxylase subunit [Candidatus Heimdallarchaeota archaeon]|nr:acetyl-CoA carboxylase biotin carboxylase subunit [Candidatus Heimdallarchaeota archaeon]
MLFNSLLVANRGEIAIRIIRAARELGIYTYAIYTPVDKNALHVKLANEAFELIEDGKTPGYLDIEQIIAICNREGIESIHPGYGFLSESEEFARRVQKIGINFIGPPPEVIELLGNKVKSRQEAMKAGLTVPEGSDIISSTKYALKEAQRIGFPVIVKAVFGGGGMGIRVARTNRELRLAIKSASAQAQAAFGRGQVFLEKFIEQPRHIEFQILADSYGNVVHLGERECSIQRRNQKLLEEAPSKALSPEKREEIGEMVCELARNLKYVSAGTVEFLYKNNQVMFNEINPRIQVEHPVTEMLTGKDIVKEQIKIALGQKLSFKQEEINFRGHAMELRINAEDPLKDFYPSPGKIKKFNAPGGPQVRFDTAMYEGFEIPNCYDSLIGKLIVGGETREEAITRALNALKELIVTGFPTNIGFFEVLLKDPKFKKGDISINFIQDQKILEKLEAEIYIKAAALFAVGLKKNEVNLPSVSKNWQIKGRLDAIGRE